MKSLSSSGSLLMRLPSEELIMFIHTQKLHIAAGSVNIIYQYFCSALNFRAVLVYWSECYNVGGRIHASL